MTDYERRMRAIFSPIRVACMILGVCIAAYAAFVKVPPIHITHPKIVSVMTRGDGYLSQHQCESLRAGLSKHDYIEKYGYPRGDLSFGPSTYFVTLRNNHRLNCQLSWDIDNKLWKVTMDLWEKDWR